MKRLHSHDRLGMALFALVVFFLAASLAVQAKLGERHERIEREDRDPAAAGAIRSTLILIDVTDALSDGQVGAVREHLRSFEEFQLQRGELVSLCSIGRYPDGDVRSWFRARFPGRAVNALVETPSRRAARVDALYSNPFRNALDEALQPSAADRTGLSAAIRESAELDGFGSGIPFRRLILVSDLMENAPEFSLYRVPLDFSLKAPPGWLLDHRANLRGVEIEVLEIPRPGLSGSERSVLRAFWRDYFRACGTATVRFGRLP